MSDGPILRSEGLGKTFGHLVALDNITLDVHAGQSLVLFGRNGAGKTTFLKIISRVIRNFSGEATLFGAPLRDVDADIRGRIGVVSHDSFLYNGLSSFDNLMFYARLYGLSDPARACEDMIERLDLARKRSALVRDLSRGMKQRLSIGRAFIHKPSLLLLDEPFTGLDERAARRLTEFLGEARQQGTAAVIATHNLERGWQAADRVAILEGGTIVYNSATAETSFDNVKSRYAGLLEAREA